MLRNSKDKESDLDQRLLHGQGSKGITALTERLRLACMYLATTLGSSFGYSHSMHIVYSTY